MMTTIPFATFIVLDRYDDYLEQLEYERQSIANEPKPGERSYIEPILKSNLEKVELELREKVKELHEGLPPSSYAVNLNHQTKEIEILVENTQLIPKIKELTTKYPDDIDIVVQEGKISFGEPLWRTDEDYCGDWCDQNELYHLGCDQPILAHLAKYSNLLDEEFDGTFYIDWKGLPGGVSQEKFDWCVDFIKEIRQLDEFDKTWGYPGNRHPAFLGYYIPDICSEDMVKFLKKNSNMFDKGMPYSSPLDGDVLDPSVNPDDMVQCENELLENRDNEPSWPGK